jgi:HSP20 family molecular chaperone IbpA
MGYKYSYSNLENSLESLSIKKNNLGNYVLYGLMWWEYTQNNKKIKSLVSIKSDNLQWDYDISINSSNEYTNFYFLNTITRDILHSFRFINIMSNDVLITLTILNEGKDGFMKYNIYERLNSYIVEVNVAGVKKDEISVVLEDGIVKVRTRPDKGDTEIYLPNIENVEVTSKDGILILTAPKKSKGVKINIK